MTIINKMTMNDLYSQLDNKLGSSEYGYASVYDLDTDKSVVYVSVWSDGGREFYSYNYTLNGAKVELDDASRKEVIKTTVYEDKPEEAVTMSKIKSFIKSLLVQKAPSQSLPVIKQFDDEEMKVVARLYIVPDTFDAHGHTISVEDTKLMVKSFEDARKAGKLKSSLFHLHETDTFYVSKSWVQEYKCTIGEEVIEENTPMCELQFKSKAAFLAKKGARLAGVSIGCKADLVDIEDEA